MVARKILLIAIIYHELTIMGHKAILCSAQQSPCSYGKGLAICIITLFYRKGDFVGLVLADQPCLYLS